MSKLMPEIPSDEFDWYEEDKIGIITLETRFLYPADMSLTTISGMPFQTFAIKSVRTNVLTFWSNDVSRDTTCLRLEEIIEIPIIDYLIYYSMDLPDWKVVMIARRI